MKTKNTETSKKSTKASILSSLLATAENHENAGRWVDAATIWRKVAGVTGERKLRIEARAKAKRLDAQAASDKAQADKTAEEPKAETTTAGAIDEAFARAETERKAREAVVPTETLRELHNAIGLNLKARNWPAALEQMERFLAATIDRHDLDGERDNVLEEIEEARKMAEGAKATRKAIDDEEAKDEAPKVEGEAPKAETSVAKRIEGEPKGAHVHSGDPRKVAITGAFKAATTCTKITLVVESSPGVFQAHCFVPKKDDPAAGNYEISLPSLAAKTVEGASVTELKQTTQISNLVAEARKHEKAGEFDRAVSVWQAVQMMAGEGSKRALAAKKCQERAQGKLDRKAAKDERDAKRANKPAKAPKSPKAPKAARERDSRIPAAGTVLEHKKGGAVLASCTVTEGGGATYEGETYKTLTSAAMAAAVKLGIKGRKSGFVFWGLVPDFPQAEYATSIRDLFASYSERVKTALVAVQEPEAFKALEAEIHANGNSMLEFLASIASRAGSYIDPPATEAPKSEGGAVQS